MARLLIVEARFYAHLNDLLIGGARAAIEAGGHSHETVTVSCSCPAASSAARAPSSSRSLK